MTILRYAYNFPRPAASGVHGFRIAQMISAQETAVGQRNHERRPNASRTIGASVLHSLSVLALFTGLTVVFFWRWMPHLDAALIGPPGDNLQDLWNSWYTVFAHRPGEFWFTRLLRFPEGTPLVYHSFAYPQVFALAFISRAIGLSPSTLLLQQNISLLSSFPLAATGAFYLARHFSGNTPGALLGGFVFAFNPSHVEHVMQHAHVSQIEFIPFFVLAFLLTIEKRSIAWLFLSIILFALNALSCWYYLFYAAYFIIFHTLYVAVRARAWPRGWQLLAPVGCLVGVIILLSPMLLPMVRIGAGGAPIYLPGSDWYVADVAAYFAFPPFHVLGALSAAIYRTIVVGSNEWEATVYLGLVNLALLGWLWLKGCREERSLLVYLLAGMAVFCVFASGDTLHVLGHRMHGWIRMPDTVLSHLPFVKDVRGVSRAIVFVYLFLAIGVGLAVTRLWKQPRPIERWAVMIVASFILVDFLPVHALPMTTFACSPGLGLIRDDPEAGFGVLDLPNSGYQANNLYMTQQLCHGRPITGGNTARDLVVSLRDRLATHDLDVQRRQLVAAHVKYIVLNRRPMGIPLPWHAQDGSLQAYESFYRVVYADSDLTVLRGY